MPKKGCISCIALIVNSIKKAARNHCQAAKKTFDGSIQDFTRMYQNSFFSRIETEIL